MTGTTQDGTTITISTTATRLPTEQDSVRAEFE